MERWDCISRHGETEYSIVPFGMDNTEYYGLYQRSIHPNKTGAAGNFLDFTKWNIEHTGYLYPNGRDYVLGELDDITSLPTEARFQSAEHCKEWLKECCAERLKWIHSEY